jgi:hypothetical protein
MFGTVLAYAKAAPFVVRKYLRGFDVDPSPWFDDEATPFFLEIVRNSKIYLEYGSGGSTVEASRHAVVVVSVETDPVFSRAVWRMTGRNVKFFTPDIGLTREHGFPVNANATPRRLKKWLAYVRTPWIFLSEQNLKPDTVLIDGRFRPSCCLETISHVDQSTRILFDDFVRSEYRVVEKYADVISMHGRMAELRCKEAIDMLELKQDLERYCTNPI